MSFGITIEQGTYVNDIISYCQRVEFLRQYSENPLIEFLIKCLEEEEKKKLEVIDFINSLP